MGTGAQTPHEKQRFSAELRELFPGRSDMLNDVEQLTGDWEERFRRTKR